MTVLVTGAPGWLGGRLTERLITDGRPVRCLVEPGRDTSSIQALGVEIIRGDVRDPRATGAAAQGMETVFHCAGIMYPRRTQDFFDINTRGTEHVLAASRAAGVRRFIYVSTIGAAGMSRERGKSLTEADPPRPVSIYGQSKVRAEQAVNRYYRESGLPTVIVRPTTYYGPGMPDRQLRLIRMVQRGRAIIFGDGQNRRSMTYIDNIVEGLLCAERSPAAVGQTYFLADRRPYTRSELMRTIADALGVPLRVYHLPKILAQGCHLADLALTRLGRPVTLLHLIGDSFQDRVSSIAKAERELGYAPAVDLREGMRRAVEWCRATGRL